VFSFIFFAHLWALRVSAFKGGAIFVAAYEQLRGLQCRGFDLFSKFCYRTAAVDIPRLPVYIQRAIEMKKRLIITKRLPAIVWLKSGLG
jgi:hypothetical protein